MHSRISAKDIDQLQNPCIRDAIHHRTLQTVSTMPGYLSDEPNLESGETSGSHGGRKSFPLNLPIEEYREAYSTTSGSRQPIHMSHGLELEEQDIPLSDGTTNRIQLIRPGKEHFFHMPHLRHRKRPIIVV